MLDSTLSIDLSKYNSLFEQQKSLKVKLTYGTAGKLYDSIFSLNFSDLALSQSAERTFALPAKQMGIMAEVLEGIRFNYADLPLQSTLILHLLHRPLAAMLADAVKISLSEQGIENETLKLNLTYEKLPLEKENVLKVNLDRLDLPHDSLFEIKLTYDRIG